MGQRIANLDIPVVNYAIDRTLEEHNRQMRALLDLFVQRTTNYSVRYRQQGARRLQPVDEKGRARPMKSVGYYDVAFPLQSGADAFGFDYVTRQKMTVEEVNNEIVAGMLADKRWIRDHILAALYTNVTWTFTDESIRGTTPTLTIQPLANGDTVQYGTFIGGDTGATENHYFATASAIADNANPFPTIYTELTEHPENGGAEGDVIAFVPTNLMSTISALTLFREPVTLDRDITPATTTSTLTGTLGVAVPGVIRGKVSKVWIVEWPFLPNDYIIAITTKGPRPLAMREDPEPQLQGFNRVAERNDHPWYESQYLRRAGFGAWNRVGALVYRIGNGSYAIPTNWSSPMP